jgi:hypothetical protein
MYRRRGKEPARLAARLVRVSTVPIRYQSAEEDSARWSGFPFREGDIVISARSKSGTTWMQMICALLVFRTPDLPAPLTGAEFAHYETRVAGMASRDLLTWLHREQRGGAGGGTQLIAR